ncbi:hypothetical protein OE88DRAFT_1668501 [Heliocybe sulcata]|uniref:Uncharacterized protein n=1 Tax=Heliocybe sulcata TaxID=5364 RepID=A0A5C3MKS6_9AGAM|nr:hypothetical protein OE88DRAFT_1668501 [Heliocybe sulcata]
MDSPSEIVRFRSHSFEECLCMIQEYRLSLYLRSSLEEGEFRSLHRRHVTLPLYPARPTSAFQLVRTRSWLAGAGLEHTALAPRIPALRVPGPKRHINSGSSEAFSFPSFFFFVHNLDADGPKIRVGYIWVWAERPGRWGVRCMDVIPVLVRWVWVGSVE